MTLTGFFVHRRLRAIALCALLVVAGTIASAQQPPPPPRSEQRITPNFRDQDIVQIADAVAAATTACTRTS